jgi:imidazolonepropionase-like amidohydrolase
VEPFHPLKAQPVRLNDLDVGWVRVAEDGGIEIRIGTDAGLGNASDLADLANLLSTGLTTLKARQRG